MEKKDYSALYIIGAVALVGIFALIFMFSGNSVQKQAMNSQENLGGQAIKETIQVKQQNLGSVIVDDLKSLYDSVFMEDVVVYGTIANHQGIVRTGGIWIMNASGNGNAYACFDTNGNIYRSQTPCN